MQYEPPEGLTPAEAGTLIDEVGGHARHHRDDGGSRGPGPAQHRGAGGVEAASDSSSRRIHLPSHHAAGTRVADAASHEPRFSTASSRTARPRSSSPTWRTNSTSAWMGSSRVSWTGWWSRGSTRSGPTRCGAAGLRWASWRRSSSLCRRSHRLRWSASTPAAFTVAGIAIGLIILIIGHHHAGADRPGRPNPREGARVRVNSWSGWTRSGSSGW